MGWTTRCMATQGEVQAETYWEGSGRRLLFIDSCAGGKRQDIGVYAVVECNTRHQISILFHIYKNFFISRLRYLKTPRQRNTSENELGSSSSLRIKSLAGL